MNEITQKVRHPWLIYSVVLAFIASVGFLTIGYFNWPPKMNFNWFVGVLTTVGTISFTITNGIRLFNIAPYRFAINDDEILIQDWGVIKSRIRTFTASSVTEICHSTEGGSFLKTTDGKTYHIDDVLMCNYKSIFELVQKNFNHIKTREL
jgi:hypothetical protein